jgi:hypothetical protein
MFNKGVNEIGLYKSRSTMLHELVRWPCSSFSQVLDFQHCILYCWNAVGRVLAQQSLVTTAFEAMHNNLWTPLNCNVNLGHPVIFSGTN